MSFYYVGDLQQATEAYSRLFGSQPVHAESEWVRFRLEGGELALHLSPGLTKTMDAPPMHFGAVVSFDVEDMDAALARAAQAGFRLAGAVQIQAWGKLAEIRDPWGNRLSFVERSAGQIP